MCLVRVGINGSKLKRHWLFLPLYFLCDTHVLRFVRVLSLDTYHIFESPSKSNAETTLTINRQVQYVHKGYVLF
jgi:hypothetical protein